MKVLSNALTTALVLMVSYAFAQQGKILTDKQGVTSRWVTFQTGVDTVQMGVPFHTYEKKGMTISITRRANASQYHFSLALRSDTMHIKPVVIDTFKTALLINTTNGETLTLKVSTRLNPMRRYELMGAVSVFLQAWLTDVQLNIIKDKDIKSVYFCPNYNDRIMLAMTNDEKEKFKRAVNYISR